MQVKDFIKMALENSKNWAMGLIGDMKETPLVQATPGGNHPLWVLGHIVHSESQLLDVMIQGKENRYPEYEEKFGTGSTPTTNADDYPSYEELAGKFEEIRAASLEYLDSLSDSDLDNKSHAPEEYSDWFGSVGKCYAAMAAHVGMHTGQVADSRRAAGKPPLMA